jgi:activator of 2-hydroxyglutaryl-CoA dehydratase
MRVAGIDIGSRTIEVVVLNERGIIDSKQADSGFDPMTRAKELLFGLDALKAKKDIQISNMCTVFAESEVTSLLARGADRQDIALGLHRSVVRRAAGMLKRVSTEEAMVFAGGVARNVCMRRLLEEILENKIMVPEDPQMVGAYGAALLAARQYEGI